MTDTPCRPSGFRKFAAIPALLGAALVSLSVSVAQGQAKPPILIGFDGDYGVIRQTSATAIERGIRVAIAEINEAGGLLGGRKLELVTKDNKAAPARGIANIKAFAEMPDLVAVFGGRFSPVMLETVKTSHEMKLPTLVPWASADGIVDNGMTPNHAFRVGLYDKIAAPAMIGLAAKKKAKQIGILAPNNGWGRSNLASAERHVAQGGPVRIAKVVWYNWGADSMIAPYQELVQAGAEAILFVANDREGAILVRELAALPEKQRVPIISHWGVTGGDFFERAGKENMAKVDYSIIQTFSFFKADPKKVEKVLARTKAMFDISRVEDIDSPVGFGHAYDLTHILARAIALAGSTDRAKIRDALERVQNVDGLVRRYERPFTPERHEAATPDQILFVKFDANGVLLPIVD